MPGDPMMACDFPSPCDDFDYELLYPVYFTLLTSGSLQLWTVDNLRLINVCVVLF